MQNAAQVRKLRQVNSAQAATRFDMGCRVRCRRTRSRPRPSRGIARAVVAGADFAPEEAIAFATSQLELRRIREVRKDLLMDLAPRELRRLAALDRYERVALTKSRWARRSLAKPAHNQVQAT